MDANTSSSRCPRLGAAAAALLLAGCTSLAPRYEAPAMPVPPQYAEAAQAGSTQAALPAWRDYFTDPALQAGLRERLKLLIRFRVSPRYEHALESKGLREGQPLKAHLFRQMRPITKDSTAPGLGPLRAALWPILKSR